MFRVGLPAARIEEAGSIEAAKRVLAERQGIELIVLDLTMDDVTGFEGLVSLRIRFPRIPILVCSGHDEPRIIREIDKQIAYDLGIGDPMVKAHVSGIMRGLGVQNRTQVALYASALDFDRAGA